LKIVATICAAVLIASTARADAAAVPYEWRNVVVGGGGFAPNIIFSPVEKGLAFLRTDMGGAYRWEERRQRWIPLEDGLAESSDFGIESIAADPKDPNTVYLAAGMYYRDPAAILRSSDRGATWQAAPVPSRWAETRTVAGSASGSRSTPTAPRPSSSDRATTDSGAATTARKAGAR
jgi:hypothetical protein